MPRHVTEKPMLTEVRRIRLLVQKLLMRSARFVAFVLESSENMAIHHP